MTLEQRLQEKMTHLEELTLWLAQPDAMSDPQKWREALKEHADLEEFAQSARPYLEDCRALRDAQELAQAEEGEMRDLAVAEAEEVKTRLAQQEEAIRLLLAPRDPNDDKNVILEIRAGTGGEEAALFATDLLKMYAAYADRRGWKLEITDSEETELGGCREVTMMISGKGAFSRLKFESGAHRVQRVPDTESGGRIHTSAATVAVLPEAEEVELEINPGDLRIDTYRASGAGGQHINRTDSAIRITHLPTGLVVECQDERSQGKNKEKAMRVLRARLYDRMQAQQEAEYSANRRVQIGTGDRSERIRTYNYPQSRVTDHRIGMTLYSLDKFMQGEMDEMLDALVLADRTERMKQSERE
ncbi:MAG: peptide chain release factor 1 [Eubacteriales bacterium]|nr:peptide chain release factor 1 [Eubacteriales bacterium]